MAGEVKNIISMTWQLLTTAWQQRKKPGKRNWPAAFFRSWIEFIRQYRIEHDIDPDWLEALYNANRDLIEGKISVPDPPITELDEE